MNICFCGKRSVVMMPFTDKDVQLFHCDEAIINVTRNEGGGLDCTPSLPFPCGICSKFP